MATLEFFFDCSSPWTYLAFARLPDIVKRTAAKVVYRPILVGGVFNAVNPEVYDRRANPDARKASYYEKDLADWARLANITIGKPKVFPVRAVSMMRCALAADEQGALLPFARCAFEAYWGALKDVSQRPVLEEVCQKAGLAPAAILARSEAEDIKSRLKANTQELIARGGFGSPTMFVDRTDMYFGNDRLPLVEAALLRH